MSATKSNYQKTMVFETPDLTVYDYSPFSYVVKTDKQWYTKNENKELIKNTLNGKFGKGYTYEDQTFAGWKIDKKSFTEQTLRQYFCA